MSPLDVFVIQAFEYGCYAWPLVFIVCCVLARKSKGDGLTLFMFGLSWPMVWYLAIGSVPFVLMFAVIIGIYYLFIGRKKDLLNG